MKNPLVYDEYRQAFHCLCCYDVIEIPRSTMRDPESFVLLRELAELDHCECGNYQDARLARNARRWRKEMKRLTLVRGARA